MDVPTIFYINKKIHSNAFRLYLQNFLDQRYHEFLIFLDAEIDKIPVLLARWHIVVAVRWHCVEIRTAHDKTNEVYSCKKIFISYINVPIV